MQVNEKVIETRTYTLQLSEREMILLLHLANVSNEDNEIARLLHDFWYASPTHLRRQVNAMTDDSEKLEDIVNKNLWKAN